MSTIHPSHLSDAVDIAVLPVTEAVLPAHESAVDEGADSRRRRPPVRGGIVKPAAVREDFLYDFKPAAVREDFLYDFKGGSLRSPPAPAAGGRKRPSSPRLQASAKPGTSEVSLRPRLERGPDRGPTPAARDVPRDAPAPSR